MSLHPRLAVRVPGLLLLMAGSARAQSVSPPETLETPYEEGDEPTAAPAAPSEAAPPPALDPPPPAAITRLPELQDSAADIRPLGPIRARRRLALMGELGWNGIAGFGPTLTFHAHPRVSFDFGVGVSFLGWKGGLRARYNLLDGPVTPFLGAGLMYTSGIEKLVIEPGAHEDAASDPEREAVTVRVEPSGFFQGVAGVDWTSRGGFTILGCLGYAALLKDDNVVVLAGNPTSDQKEVFQVAFRSGLVITIGTGYTFN
jgi:hypothetical protein